MVQNSVAKGDPQLRILMEDTNIDIYIQGCMPKKIVRGRVGAENLSVFIMV